MKHGIESAVGQVLVTVTEDMTARLDGVEIHPVYSTFWACYHAEVAARRAIEPFFEPDENAVGSHVAIDHKAMVAIGATLTVTAKVVRIELNRILCTIVISSNNSIIVATGSQEQVVLSSAKLQSLVARACS